MKNRKESKLLYFQKRFNGIVEWIKRFNFWLTDYICSYFIVVMAYLLEFEAFAFYILIWMNTCTVIYFASMNIEFFDLFKHLILVEMTSRFISDKTRVDWLRLKCSIMIQQVSRDHPFTRTILELFTDKFIDIGHT